MEWKTNNVQDKEISYKCSYSDAKSWHKTVTFYILQKTRKAQWKPDGAV